MCPRDFESRAIQVPLEGPEAAVGRVVLSQGKTNMRRTSYCSFALSNWKIDRPHSESSARSRVKHSLLTHRPDRRQTCRCLRSIAFLLIYQFGTEPRRIPRSPLHLTTTSCLGRP